MTKKQKKELVRVTISAIIIDEDTFEHDLKSSKRICNGIKVALKTNGVSMKKASVQGPTCGGFYDLTFWANADDLSGIFAVARNIGATNIEFEWSDVQ
jgi:hypothetical protein